MMKKSTGRYYKKESTYKMNRFSSLRCFLLISVLFLTLFSSSLPVAAEGNTGQLSLISGSDGGERTYAVEDSAYKIYMNDEQNLLTPSEEEELLDYMLPITEYGNVAFMTTLIGSSNYEGATRDIYHNLFGSDSGIIFLIDMNHRQLVIFSDGDVYKVITKSYANTITDNVYRLARKGDYSGCAEEVFAEVYTLLIGDKIAQPMRHITNALLAITLSTLILYYISRRISKQRAAQTSEILTTIGAQVHFSNGTNTHTKRDKVYNPHTSDSDGGRGFGGGGGGGGGFSGGGGSHGF